MLANMRLLLNVLGDLQIPDQLNKYLLTSYLSDYY